MKHWTSLLPFLLIVAAISYIGSIYTMPAVQSWYTAINKPAWNPPNWVFGPVWTTLYIMIAISGWRVWRRLPGNITHKLRKLLPYWLQLALNCSWPIVFFGQGEFVLACLNITALLIAILWNIRRFKPIDSVAAYLLIPYAAWVAYAATLNFAIAALN